MYDTAQPYIASYVLLRKEGKIGFVLRSNTKWMNGYYGLPSGKVEKTESFSEAAIREGLEEAGVTIQPDKLTFIHAAHRFSPDNGTNWVDIYFEPKDYKGEPHNAEPEAHSEFVWLDLNDLPDNVIPSTVHALKQIQKGEAYSEYGFNS